MMKKPHTWFFQSAITISSNTTLARILGIVKLSRSGFILRCSRASDAKGSITGKQQQCVFNQFASNK